MLSKIIEKIVEPSKITVGSTFLLKIKAIRYLTYEEIKTKPKTYEELMSYTYSKLKGE